jgi:hypothetical protein
VSGGLTEPSRGDLAAACESVSGGGGADPGLQSTDAAPLLIEGEQGWVGEQRAQIAEQLSRLIGSFEIAAKENDPRRAQRANPVARLLIQPGSGKPDHEHAAGQLSSIRHDASPDGAFSIAKVAPAQCDREIVHEKIAARRSIDSTRGGC